MGRPPLAPGTYGSITVAWSEREKAFKARARYRDADGRTRPVARFAATKGGAERALKAALRDRMRVDGLDISADMLVADLTAAWLAGVERSDLAVGTKQHYAKIAKSYVVPALGALHVREARVAACNTALRTIRERHGYSIAKSSRAVLSGILGLAARHDALSSNPVRDTERLPRGATKQPRALTPTETQQLTDRLRTIPRAASLTAPGDPPGLDLCDLVDLMLMTGARIGEVLACRQDTNRDGLPLVDFTAGTWEIDATIVRITGSGLVVQERPKSESGHRVLALPPAALELIQRRLAEPRLRPHTVRILDDAGTIRTGTPKIVFPSPSARSLRDPNNCQGDLREVLDRIDCPHCDDTGWQRDEQSGRFLLTDRGRRIRCALGPWSWITSHNFRKTVATRMEEAGCTARQVADQLGHSKVSMTQDVYFGRGVAVAVAARILEPTA